MQEPFLYLQIPSFTHSDSVTSVLKIRIVSAVATQSKIKHRLTDAQTYVGLPSTSVTVRCFFMSACFTVMSLSSGLTSSRLQRNAKLFIYFFLFSCHNENSVVAETRTVFWTSCRFTSVQLQLSGSQPLQRHPPIKKTPQKTHKKMVSTQEPHKKEKEKLLA